MHQNQDLHNFIGARLKKQQEDSEKDSQWLIQQEDSIKKRLSVASLNGIGNDCNVVGKPPIAEKPVQPSIRNTNPSSSLQGTEKPAEINIERKNDPVYICVTAVVKAVMKLSSGVEKSQKDDYLELVKTVGLELRTLLGTVDLISAKFPTQTFK